MIVPYTELPMDAGGWARPLVDLVVAGMDDVFVPCLVDSGSLHTLVPSWVANAAGIEHDAMSPRHLRVAGAVTEARFATTRLAAGPHGWEAEVGFCDPWPYGWGLAGQLSFFRYFTVTFRATDFEFELAPVTR